MLIRTFGQFWNPDAVAWGSRGAGNKGSLLGKAKVNKKTVEVDFWDQVGIYILHDEFRTVYIGKAMDQPIGKRLRDHLTDRFAGRWDMFSWYGLKGLTKSGQLQKKAGGKNVKPGSLATTLEAFGILLTDAPLNRKREKLPSATQVEQKKAPHPHTVRHYLEKLIEHHKIQL
jgi:hypothetical protein